MPVQGVFTDLQNNILKCGTIAIMQLYNLNNPNQECLVVLSTTFQWDLFSMHTEPWFIIPIVDLLYYSFNFIPRMDYLYYYFISLLHYSTHCRDAVFLKKSFSVSLLVRIHCAQSVLSHPLNPGIISKWESVNFWQLAIRKRYANGKVQLEHIEKYICLESRDFREHSHIIFIFKTLKL